MKTYILPTKISEGLFSNEKAVVLDTCHGNTSGFISKQHIKNRRLEVKICFQEKGLTMVKIPGRMLEAPGDKGYLTLKSEDIKYEK